MNTAERPLKPAFVLVTDNEWVSQRLNDSIGSEGDLLITEAASLERILQLIDSVGAALAIVHVPAENKAHHLFLIEELHARKPILPILVFAEAAEPDVMLAIMRSGACDLVTRASSREEVQERLQTILRKMSHFSAARERPRGKIVSLVSARADADAAILCLHIALALCKQAPNQKTLLLDLGIPEGDTIAFLDLQASYSFVDAIRSIRRFDDTLIETAFAKHDSGLALLAMPEEATADDITANDVIVLLNILRTYFQYVIINLNGLRKSPFLQLTTANSDQIFLLCEQTVPSCRGNKKLMDFLAEHQPGIPVELIVDRYLEKQEPSGQEIAERFGIPLRATLPSSGMARLYMKNSGRSFYEFAPQDKYAVAVEGLAKSLLGVASAAESHGLFAMFKWLSKHD